MRLKFLRSLAPTKIKKLTSTVAVIALVAGVLTVVAAAPAQADTTPGTGSQAVTSSAAPTKVDLAVASSTSTTITVNATIDQPLAQSNSTLSFVYLASGYEYNGSKIDDVTYQYQFPRKSSDYKVLAVVDPAHISSNWINIPASTGSLNPALTPSATSFSTDDVSPTLAWSWTGGTVFTTHGKYIVDVTTGLIVTVLPNTGLSGTAAIPRIYSGQRHQYAFYMGDAGDTVGAAATTITNTLAISSSKFIGRTPWNVSISVSATSFGASDTSPSINWATNQSVTNTNSQYALYVCDVTTSTIIGTVTSGTKSGSIPITRFYSGPAHQYEAYIAATKASSDTSTACGADSNFSDIQAESNLTSIARASWNVNATISSSSFTTADATPTVTWSANQALDKTNSQYSAYLVDETAHAIISQFTTGSGSKALITRFLTGDPHNYDVYVAERNANYTSPTQFTDVQAVSPIVTTARAPWTAGLSVDKTTYSYNDSTPPQFTWTTNQPISSSASSYIGAYAFYLFDITANKRVYYYGSSNTSTGNVDVPAVFDNNSHLYRLYVAAAVVSGSPIVTDYTQLTDIQAASSDIQVQQQQWVVHTTVNKTSFNTNDAAYSNRGLVISWSVNQNLANTGRTITPYLVNETTGVVYYSTLGTSTTTSGTFTVPLFNSGASENYAVYIAQNAATGKNNSSYRISDLNILGQSASMTISRAPWSISVNAVSSTFLAGSSPDISYTTNQQLGLDTPGCCNIVARSLGYYGAYLIDTTTDTIFYSNNSTDSQVSTTDAVSNHYSAAPFYTGGPHYYEAVVAKYDAKAKTLEDLQDIQAQSGTISVSRAPWSVSLSAPGNNGSYYNFDALANQSVSSTNNSYENFLVYTNTGRIGQIVYNATEQDYPQKSWYTDTPDKGTLPLQPYKLYIAAYNPTAKNVSQLTDIQAVSGASFIGANGGPVQNGEAIGGSNPSESNCQSCQGDPVNTLTGEFFEDNTDLSLSSNIPLDFVRSYSSANTSTDGAFGSGWTDNYGMQVQLGSGVPAGTALSDAATLTVSQENTSTISFIKDNYDGSYSAAYRVYATLQKTADGFVLTRNNGYQFLFDGTTGFLKSVSDRDGNTLSVTTDSTGKVLRISADSGQWLNVTWAGSHITQLDDSAGRKVVYSYNSANRLVSVTTPDTANPTTYTYDSSGLLLTETYPNGGVTTNVYTAGKVTKQTDPMENVTSFNYVDRYTTDTTLPNGSVTREIYNGQAQLTSQTKAYGTALAATTSYLYGSTSQVTKETNPDGYSVAYTYDANGNVTTTRDPNGNYTYYTYNTFNEITKITDPTGAATTAQYDSKGNLLSSISAAGNTTKYTFNPNGTKASILDPNQVAAGGTSATQIGYDNAGHVNSTTSPNGNTTSVTNDALGQILAAYDPQGNETDFTYNKAGQTLKTTDSTGDTVNTYDDAGQLIKTVDQIGDPTSYKYDLNGNVTEESTYSQLPKNEYSYDNMGNLTQTQTVAGSKTLTSSITYNSLGQPLTSTDPMGNITTDTWSLGGRLLTETDPMGNITKYTYDANGNVTQVTDPAGDVATATYTKLNQLATSASAAGETISYTYDKDGNILTETKNDGSVMSYKYDNDGNILSTTDSTGVLSSNTYDAEGNTLQSTVAGQTTSYSYNNLDQNTTTIRPDGSTVKFRYNTAGSVTAVSYDNWATTDTSYVYDALQRVQSETKNGTTTGYSYDLAGNLTSRGPPSAQVQYSYDDLNQLTKLQYTNGTYSNYSYDDNGNLLNVTADGTIPAVSYTYNKNDQMTQSQYGNGVQQSYTYNSNSEATGTTAANSSNQLYSQQETLNKDGFITANATTDDQSASSTKNYTYDALNRIKTETQDSNASTNYSFDTRNQLLTNGATSNTFAPTTGELTTAANTTNNTQTNYTYDARGNRVGQALQTAATDSIPASTTSTSYTWTNDDKLANVQNASGTYSYNYDSTGLTTSKTSTPADGAAPSTQNMVWDATTDIPTLLQDGNYSYIYGNGDTPVAQFNMNSGEVSYLTTDLQGSVSLLTDDSGNALAQYSYDTYGNATSSEDSSHNLTAFGYAGQYLDTDTGLYNLRARWYDPTTAGFLSVDPLLAQTGDPYGYASGNPISFEDPTGLASWSANMNSLGQAGWGVLDGISGGASTLAVNEVSNLLNVTSPIKTCSTAFKWGIVGGTILSFVIPGDQLFGAISLAGDALKLDRIGIVTAEKLSTIAGKLFKDAHDVTPVALTKWDKIDKSVPIFYVKKSKYDQMYARYADDQAKWTADASEGVSPLYTKNAGRREAELNRSAAQAETKAARRAGTETRPPGTDMDENPPASTREGGKGAIIRNIDSIQNQAHGRDLAKFYRDNKIVEGSQFLQIPWDDIKYPDFPPSF